MGLSWWRCKCGGAWRFSLRLQSTMERAALQAAWHAVLQATMGHSVLQAVGAARFCRFSFVLSRRGTPRDNLIFH